MSMMDNEEEASLSHEEELIDSLFFRCDTHGEGKVHVYTVIQFLKNCLGNGNNEPDLYELTNILESDSIDGKVSLNSYRNAVKQWVAEIRNRCESTSFLEPDGPLQSTSDRNFSSNASDISVCIETSGIGDGSFHRTEKDLGELLQEIEDLKFQNRKFSDDVTQLHQQLETQEEITTNLTTELQGKDREEDLLRKKIKTMQDLIDLRQTVMDENEELKSKLVISQGLKRDLDSKIVSLERENLNLESQVKNYESKWQMTCTELETARKELIQLQGTFQEHKNQLLTVQVAKASQEDVLAEEYGMEEEADYPYVGQVSSCKYNQSLVKAKTTGYVRLPKYDEVALANAVAEVGPIAVGIDATQPSFHFYKSGVYNEIMCRTDSQNHAVLAVGYGTSYGNDYWLVKNSWGTSWGINGYIKMSRNKYNQCGIANSGIYPLM